MVNGTNVQTSLDAVAYTFGEGVRLLEKIIPVIQAFAEEGVDELLEQSEKAAATVANAQTGGVEQAGGMTGLWIALLIVAIIAVLMMLLVIGRRNRSSEENTENPLFEDQFAVQEDEIEIEIDDAATGTSLFVDDSDDDNTGAEEEVSGLGFSRDDEIDEDEITITEEEEEPEAEPAYAAADEPAEEDLGEEPEAYEEAYEESENIIRLSDRAEAEEEPVLYEEEEAPAEDPQETDYYSAASLDEQEAVATDQEAPAEEDQQVRYAATASKSSPIAFSAISGGDDGGASRFDEEPVSARPYIAPTVLRDDMEKLERHQSERMETLRDDLTRQISAMKAEHNNRLDLIIGALDRKLENLAESTRRTQQDSIQPFAAMTPEINRQIGTLQATLDNQAQRIRAITQILDDRLGSVTHVYGEVRGVGERLEALTNKLDQMEQSFTDRAQQDVIADVQLSDVIRSSLSPDAYEFKPLLGNNHRADCLIRLPHPPGAIVIDTKFPLDAFSALPPREDVARGVPQAKAAEDAFRRAVLRHIIDVAERFIIPGETADSALLFLPTEAIYTTLHARFPDLVRDSFRARVWIVSPSTLMGTLQTLRGVLRDSREQQQAENVKREAQEVMSEVETLRAQAASLAQNFENTQNELRSLLDATSKVANRSSSGSRQAAPSADPERDALMSQLYDNKPEWPGKPAGSRDGGGKTPPDDLR